MTKVFIGGSRKVSRLDADVCERIDSIVRQRLHVLIGDANGADKAVQHYLRDKGYQLVEVFCAGGVCRNNAGNWPLRAVSVASKKKDFGFYTAKDRLMAKEASVGFMIWDGASVGTLLNVLRLLRQNKKVAIYSVPARTFNKLNNETDWTNFVLRFPSDLRQRVEDEAANDEGIHSANEQMALL